MIIMFQVIENKQRDLDIFLELAKKPNEHTKRIEKLLSTKLIGLPNFHEVLWKKFEPARKKLSTEIKNLLSKYPIEELIPKYTGIPWVKVCKIYVSFGVMGRASENRIDIGYLREWKNLLAVLLHELIHFNTASTGKEGTIKELATDILRDKVLEDIGFEKIGFFENKKYNPIYFRLYDTKSQNFDELLKVTEDEVSKLA